jgi:aconitate hydratase
MKSTLKTSNGSTTIHLLPVGLRLPFTLKILLENLMRHEDGVNVTKDDIRAIVEWNPKKPSEREISYMPARVVLQDFTGVPCVVDLASMRDTVAEFGGDPQIINPLQRVDLVIDHSVQVDVFGAADSFEKNVEIEYGRNKERYSFLRWGQTSLKNFRVVPPGTGIVHQVNLEYLADVVLSGNGVSYPDTVIGTDSHTTMINGLGVPVLARAGSICQPRRRSENGWGVTRMG